MARVPIKWRNFAPKGLSPYVHWADEIQTRFHGGKGAVRVPSLDPDRDKRMGAGADRVFPGGANKTKTSKAWEPLPDFGPVPYFTKNKQATIQWIPDDLAKKTSPPPKNSVIVGIIDEAIALGHQRFRHADGKTRFLYAWQMGAEAPKESLDPKAPPKACPPFGSELFETDINNLIEAHSTGNWLDEEAFNKAAGLSEMILPQGVRALERRVAHGTHVLDLATGFDAHQSDPETLARLPIMAVTLPRRESVGMAGTYLQFFAIYAMQRIVDLADALWSAHYPDDKDGGFPVVINLSFGQHAGPKDGTSRLEKLFLKIQEERKNKAPVRLVMPIGNDNLRRGNARWKLKKTNVNGKPGYMEFSWRILPEDQTSNFVEIWSDAAFNDADQQKIGTRNPLQLSVRPPGQDQSELIQGKPGKYTDLEGGARVYCLASKAKISNGQPRTRYSYVVCTRPTLNHENHADQSPAGEWQLRLQWDQNTPDHVFHNEKGKDEGIEVYCMVQVDQSAEPEGLTNRRSYFDHDRYFTYYDFAGPNYQDIRELRDLRTELGRVLDTYAYPVEKMHEERYNLEWAKRFRPLQRKGTHNALTNLNDIVVVGGYRASDGRPASYSATTYGSRRSRSANFTVFPVALPTESGPMHFGVLASGSRSGSVVAMSGTSFAAGQATRLVASELLKWSETQDADRDMLGSSKWLRDVAEKHEEKHPFEGACATWKCGNGRVQVDETGRVPRTGHSW